MLGVKKVGFGCILGSFLEEMIILTDFDLKFTGMSQNQVPKIDFLTPSYAYIRKAQNFIFSVVMGTF